MSGRVLVVGVGNELRRDDGFGAATVAELETDLRPAVETVALDGEPARLVEAWSGTDLAIVVDACSSGSAPGTIHRVDLRTGDPLASPVSTHGSGVAEAVRLGAALGRLPRRLLVFAVEGADFGRGTGLSGPVRAAVGVVVELLRQELDDHERCPR